MAALVVAQQSTHPAPFSALPTLDISARFGSLQASFHSLKGSKFALHATRKEKFSLLGQRKGGRAAFEDTSG